MKHHHSSEERQHRMAGPEGGRGGGGPRGGRFGPAGPGARGAHFRGREQEVPSADGAAAWFAGRLPDGWFSGPPEITIDRDEILVLGTIESPVVESDDEQAAAAAEAGRLSRFREETREQRIAIALEAEGRYGRKVSWGARAGESRQVFTTLSVPVMTRLRQPERQVLDTLVEAGVARSRSDALAWCVALVGEHSDSWLAELRDALTSVQRVREQGPGGATTAS